MKGSHVSQFVGFALSGLATLPTDAFQVPSSAFLAVRMGKPEVATGMPSRLLMAGKGFGTPDSKGTPSASAPTPNSDDNKSTVEVTAQPVPSSPPKKKPLTALERMRRDEAEKRDAELRKVRELRSVDEFVKDDPTAAVIPEKVAMRMGSRMLPFVGIPLFGGMGAFVAFWYLATYKNMEFQPAMVATTTIGLLVVGLLGITYSLMSASWDPDREGSTMGVDEFNRNIDSLKDGLKRSRENAVLRERMAGMPEEEIEKAIRELDRRDEAKRRRDG